MHLSLDFYFKALLSDIIYHNSIIIVGAAALAPLGNFADQKQPRVNILQPVYEW